MNEWAPGAVGVLAIVLNQYINWRRERRDERKDQRAEKGDELTVYRSQMEGVIAALERRVKLAEEAEKRYGDRCVVLAQLVKDKDVTITRLSRLLAHANGDELEDP